MPASPSPHSFVVTQSRDISFSNASDPAHRPNELLRALELLRYYTPPSPLPAEGVPIKSDTFVMGSGDDPALEAFSQLLALKLHCERSMISLIDRTNQYVIAEATRTLSVADPTQQLGIVVPDRLWLGCKTIPAQGGLCTNTIQLYPDDKKGPDEFSLLEIADLTLDPRSQNCDYVLNYPHLKFYAGTPLRTKRGYNIGSICVVDSSPHVLTMEDKVTLGWMGKLVMQHLEMTAERGALRRNQRMVESIGRFVSGKHTLTSGNDSGSGSSSDDDVQAGDVGRRSGSSSVTLSPEGNAVTLEEIFSRAGVLVRAALMTDGVVFVDAGEVYGTSALLQKEGSASRAGFPWRGTGNILGCSCADHQGERNEVTADPCAVEERNTVHGKVPSDSIIQQMLDLYPLGTIIFFDEQTPSANVPTTLPASNSPAGEASFPDVLSTSEEEVFRALQEFIPECASVLFMPLFHNGGKPYAASFSWTYDVLRVFTSDELSYIQGFMGSIMSEVSRLNTLSADKAKGDFISSISHELRSPLHGVLASTEFLAETTLDPYQRRFVDTAESCGRMLLDTVNHVLDFRKLISLVRDQNTQVGLSAEDGSAMLAQHGPSCGGVVSLIEATDISALTEHVIECVYAGYEFKGISSLGFMEVATSALDASLGSNDIGLLSNRSGLSNMRGASHYAREAVTVILDFEKRDNWTFVAHPGAMRRILMNIFANALKYTDTGWVRVHLQAEDLPVGQEGDNGKSKITLTVSDSGRGISREFLKTKLFTPFSQEDTLTSGTGLGMSIVQQIVQLLGADIDVKSQVNVGTAVTLTFVLESPPEGNICQPELLRLREHTVGKTICLIGFEPLLSTGSNPSSPTLATTHDTLASLQESLARYAKEWFGMSVVIGTLSTKGVDISLANESDDLVRHLEENPKTAAGQSAPLIVLCSNVSRYRDYIPQDDLVLKFVSKPCGPMKLAKALQFCFERSSKQDLAHVPASAYISSYHESSVESGPNHYQGLLSQAAPAPATYDTEVEQDTLVTDIRCTPSLTSASSLSAHPISLISGTLGPIPIVRMTAEEIVKPLNLTPNVLIVEDNEINLMLLATFMKKKKYPFTKAENGLLGVEAVKAEAENFDVILMDLQMPVMSGFEATKAIRKLEAENVGIMKRSFIIALTGLADSGDVDEAYNVGVDLFLTKPVPFKTVDRELEKWKDRVMKLATVERTPVPEKESNEL